MALADFHLGEFVVHPTADRLTRGKLRVDLQPKTMAVLLALVARHGEVVSSDELIREVWHDRPMGDNPVYKAIAKLRRALDDESEEPRYIETIACKGYRLLMKPRPLRPDAMSDGGLAIAKSPERRPPPATDWKLASIAAALSMALLAIGIGFATYETGNAPVPDMTSRPATMQLYFPGLESDSAGTAAINAMIRDRLSHLPGLAVSDRAVDAPLAGLRLSGSLQAEGERLHVKLRLDGERGSGLWVNQLVMPAAESYRIADHIAAAVQEATNLGLHDQELARLPFPTLQRYLLARSELRERHTGFRQRLANMSAELVRVAPDFAAGHAIRAVACIFAITHNTLEEISAGMQCARDEVASALKLDPELAEAHAAAGLLAQNEEYFCHEACAERRWFEAAQRSLERAVRLDPSLLEARIWLGNIYDDRGDLAHASEQRDAALALDPLSPVANHNMNSMLLLRGENEAVRTRLLQLVRAPNLPGYIYEQLAEVAISTGRMDEARTWARRAAAEAGHRWSMLASAVLLARSGMPDEARAMYALGSRDPEPYEAEELEYRVRLQQLLGGSAAVRNVVDLELNRSRTPASYGATADRKLKRIVGWALALADQPERARLWLEEVYGASGMPTLRLGDALTEADGLEALAWSYEMTNDAARSRALARSALELLSTLTASGFDQQVRFALNRALAFKLAGERDAAIAELERAVALGWTEPASLQQDPRWSSVQGDPEVQALLARADERAAAVRVVARH